jgi:predicted metal-dependent hydrolase
MQQALYLHALDLFNGASFFDAHEVWEDVWRAAPPEEKKFLQGLIQIAVAFHHHSTGNLVGARSLLDRGTRNLQGYPEEHGDLKLAVFLHSLAAWKRALADGGPLPPLPHIERCEG